LRNIFFEDIVKVYDYGEKQGVSNDIISVSLCGSEKEILLSTNMTNGKKALRLSFSRIEERNIQDEILDKVEGEILDTNREDNRDI
jgi:hypothetical protein